MNIVAFPQPPLIRSGSRPVLSEIVPLGAHSRVFPPGVEAIHQKLGWVYIQFARGNRRQVIWYDEDDSDFEEPRIVARVAWVWLSELRLTSDQTRPPLWQRYMSLGMLKVPDLTRFPFSMIEDKDADRFGLRSA